MKIELVSVELWIMGELWIMDDAKCPIFVALIMVVAAEIVIGKSDICVW